MDVRDYNGAGLWSRAAIQQRYRQYASEAGATPRDLSPLETSDRGTRWIFPMMDRIIDGIEAGDPACVRIGIEFIEDDVKLPFGKILKSNAARALRRTRLTDPQKQRIRVRVFSLLRAGHIPHEFREYAKLARTVGYPAEWVPPEVSANRHVERFRRYFAAVAAARSDESSTGE